MIFWNVGGAHVGAPSSVRAWMCTIAAPASYARRASSAISTGVYGIAGQCFLVVTAPVSAHDRMTLSPDTPGQLREAAVVSSAARRTGRGGARSNVHVRICALACLFVIACGGGQAATPAAPPSPGALRFRVMTYNVNFGLAGDPAGVAAIASASPDIVMLQETNDAWAAALIAGL